MKFKKRIITLLIALTFIVSAFLLPARVQATAVQQQFIHNNRSYQYLKPIGIVIHDTDNVGSTAQNNRDYFNRVYVAASAHYFVDWSTDIQCIPENETAWHAGPTANHRYLSIEMCMPYGHNVSEFDQVYQNTVELAANICKRYGWSSANIYSHYWCSMTFHETNHEDPLAYLQEYGKSWNDLLNDIQKAINGQTVITPGPVQVTGSTATLQANLNKLKFGNLAVDNSYGPATRSAVRNFQSVMGLIVDGSLGPITQGAINQILSKPTDNIKAAHLEYATRYIQWRVGANVDGWYGYGTARSVRVWQSNHGLCPDSSVGPASWKVLLQ